MSIKGVDSQIMLSRAPDFVNEAASQLKGGERMQEALAKAAKVQDEHEKNMVLETEDSPRVELQLENEGGGSGEYAASGRKKRSEEDYSILDSELGPNEHIIDIRL